MILVAVAMFAVVKGTLLLLWREIKFLSTSLTPRGLEGNYWTGASFFFFFFGV